MRYRKLDANWDYVFGRGSGEILTDLEAVAQAIHTRLLLLYSEWWEDQEDGLPLFENILGVPGGDESIKAVDLIIRERIENTTGVLSVTDFASAFKDRQYVFQAQVETIYGSLTIGNA